MQKFRQEMMRALIQTTVMFFIAVFILKAVTGRYPWQMGEQMGIEVEQASGTPTGSATSGAKLAADHGDYEF